MMTGLIVMRWSLLIMLGFFAIASIALALGEFSPVVSGVALSSVLAIAWIGLPTWKWRRLAYGSVIGVVFAMFLLAGYTYVRLGRLGASNYQESNEMQAIGKPWTPYLIPVGALFGATVATISSRRLHADAESGKHLN
jgi:hypothetical protein